MKPQFSGSKTFGERSGDLSLIGFESESERDRQSESELREDLSDIEKKLLQSYPGESKHLDDSQDHVHSDIFYYTEWDDPIYDQFQDYDYEESTVEEVPEDTFEPVKEAPKVKELPANGEIHIDLSRYPQRLPRSRPASGKSPSPGQSAGKCARQHCALPDCHCGGPEVPGNLTRAKTPQLVILTFDDSLNDLNKKLYESIFHPIRRNPNGCPISATFYVSHEWTDYSHVQNVYSDGHEIASHSIRLVSGCTLGGCIRDSK